MSLARTEESLAALEEALCVHHGDLAAACRALRTSPRYVHMWLQADPEVATRIKAAQMMGWAGLEGILYERAVIGVEEDVYYQGDVVGTKTVRSDGLLTLMAKARIPGYNADTNHAHTHMVNVNIMPRASSYEEWAEQRTKELEYTPAIEGVVREIPATPVLPPADRAPLETIQARVRELTRPHATGTTGLRDVL